MDAAQILRCAARTGQRRERRRDGALRDQHATARSASRYRHFAKLAKSLGRNHRLALELWDSGIHEARILATIIDEPERVTQRQMEHWARDFDSWDVCDQACHESVSIHAACLDDGREMGGGRAASSYAARGLR